MVAIGRHNFKCRRWFVPRVPSAPELCISVRQWPGRLAIGPINRSIEEERRVQVLVRDNNVDQALRVLKKKMQREGIFREMKLRGRYEKPSEKENPGESGSHPPRPQARPQKDAARGSAADEASGDPRGPRKRRPRALPSLLISEQP